jgi:hypothetical protein
VSCKRPCYLKAPELISSSVLGQKYRKPQLAPGGKAVAEVIRIDEEAAHVESFFDRLTRPAWFEAERSEPDLETAIATRSIAKRFGFTQIGLEVKEELSSIIPQNSMECLEIANWREDLDLGKEAIRSLDGHLYSCMGIKGEFWEMISDMRLEWQLELVRKLLSRLEGDSGEDYFVVENDMDEVAEEFNPK